MPANSNSSETSNIKFLSGGAVYAINASDDVINCDTTLGGINLYLPKISNIFPKRFYINDYAGQASVNNIIIFGSGDTINGGTSYVINVNGQSCEALITGQTEWLINSDNSTSSGVYTGASPTTTTVGGLPSGSNISGMSFNDLFESILVPYVAPTFTSFSISGQATSVEVGTTISGLKTFIWTTSTPANIQTNSIAIKDITNSTTLGSGLANDGSESLNVGSITLNTITSHTWRAEATNTQSSLFVSSNFTVSSYFRLFYGTSVSATLNEVGIEALTGNPLSSGFSGTYAFVAGDYKYICFPDSFGSPVATNGFKDANTGFPISMAEVTDDPFYSNVQNGWYYGLVSVTNGLGVTTNYRVYRSQNILGGTINITVS